MRSVGWSIFPVPRSAFQDLCLLVQAGITTYMTLRKHVSCLNLKYSVMATFLKYFVSNTCCRVIPKEGYKGTKYSVQNTSCEINCDLNE